MTRYRYYRILINTYYSFNRSFAIYYMNNLVVYNKTLSIHKKNNFLNVITNIIFKV